jgi:adenine-specific DNA-methyltransferase
LGTIYRLFDLALGKDSHDLVLDFFSGSATTAQSLFKFNAEKNSKNKIVLVQLQEKCSENSEAYKSGYKTICEIGKERIRRAGDKIKQEHPDADIDIGFKVFRVADTNVKWNSLIDMGQIDIKQLETTPDQVDFMPDANDIDVVYEMMLRQRDIPLSETLETLTDIGSRTYLYASSFLVCLETEITTELIEKISEIDPLPIKFIFRDSAFKDDIALKDETFRRLKALVEKNSGTNKPTYTVEFI